MNEITIIISILSGLIVAMISLIQYILKSRSDSRKREFDTYHNLITELVVPQIKYKDVVIEKVKERQAAIVFELRNYKKRYSEISIRILNNFKEQELDTFLLEEINRTITFLEN